MQDTLQVGEQYYILATSSLAHEPGRVLKHGDAFAIFDDSGDLSPFRSAGAAGLFYEDTRFLSRLELTFNARRLLLLSSHITRDNLTLNVDLTNPDLSFHGEVDVERGSLHIARSCFLWNGALYQRVRVANFGQTSIESILSLRFDADFRDIFEVRGAERDARGTSLPHHLDDDTVVLAYRGRDGVTRSVRLTFHPRPSELTQEHVSFHAVHSPGGTGVFDIVVACERSDRPQRHFAGYDSAAGLAAQAGRALAGRDSRIHTSNAQFDEWLSRSLSDLRMMSTDTRHGPYPYAGVPWFSTVFGRDGIFTALQTLWINPDTTRGVLNFLAATQADSSNKERESQPGKIVHEFREGEMANCGEVPFGRYYGSVDATPLFVMLAGAYFEHTADRGLLERIWPNIERALAWMDNFGDVDQDGFLEYVGGPPRGLVNQGWKDSTDSIFHADGSLAEGPIALCEVQAYCFAARRAAAGLADALGLPHRAGQLRAQAEHLRDRFERAFWSDDLGMYALALDGHKRPCLVRSSNAGHALFCGIASESRARRTAASLLSPAFFSDWGIRTIATTEARYNPMSYHNGSIWPHDNAIIATGLANYGMKDEAARVLAGLFDTALFVQLYRLPELFCGFQRRPGQGPTLYPVACAPQAWAAGAVFMLLQACLGLRIRAAEHELRLTHAILPPFLTHLVIEDLRVGDAHLDLILDRHDHGVSINVSRREGEVRIVAIK